MKNQQLLKIARIRMTTKKIHPKPSEKVNSRPVIKIERPDARDVRPEIAMNSRAFDTQDYT